MRRRRSVLAACTGAAVLCLGAQAGQGLSLHVDRVEEHGPAGSGALLLILDERSRVAFAAWSRRHVGKAVNFSVGGEPVLRARLTGPVESGTIVLPAEPERRSGAIQLVLAHGKGLMTATAAK